jgi:hypothetical protein
VDGRGIQRVLAAADTQKAGALFICLLSELGDFFELFAVNERAVFFAVGGDVPGDRAVDSGYIAEQ